MAWTQSQIDNLEQAYKEGVLTVEFNGRKTTYRSMAEMKQLLEEARAELAGKTRSAYLPTSYNRGYQ